MTVSDYQIVTDTTASGLQTQVLTQMGLGWKPLSSVVVLDYTTPTYAQAMIKVS